MIVSLRALTVIDGEVLAFGSIQPLPRRSSHLLLEVPDKESELEGWTEKDFLDRLTILGDEKSTKLLLSQLAMFQGNGNKEGVADIVEGVRRRIEGDSRIIGVFALQ